MKNELWIRFNYNDERYEDYNIIEYNIIEYNNIYKNLNYVFIKFYDEEMERVLCRSIYLNDVDYIEIYKDGICILIKDIKKED